MLGNTYRAKLAACAGRQAAHVARCLGVMLQDMGMRDLVPAEDLAQMLPVLQAIAGQCTASIQVPHNQLS